MKGFANRLCFLELFLFLAILYSKFQSQMPQQQIELAKKSDRSMFNARNKAFCITAVFLIQHNVQFTIKQKILNYETLITVHLIFVRPFFFLLQIIKCFASKNINSEPI